MPWVGRAIVGAVVLIAGLGVSSAGASSPLAGDVVARFKHSSTRPGADRATLKFRPNELPLTIADPTCTGAPSTIRISTSAAAGTPIDLSCVNWVPTSRGFRYVDRLAADGGTRKVSYESGKLQISLQGLSYSPVIGPVTFVEITFQVGSVSYCARIETFDRNQPERVMARGTTLPCAAPATATATEIATPPATPTLTRTSTPSATAVATSTAVSTSTRTSTATPSRTGTSTYTRTATPPATSTFTGTPPSTATATLTSTRSSTPTSTPTRTPTRTHTPTRSPTPMCGNSVVEGDESCDDGNVTSADCCSSTCQLEAAGSACTSDGNPCTNDQCDAAAHCLHLTNTATCDDGNECTQNDRCTGGSCGGDRRKPWINEVNYDGYDPIFVTRDHEEFVEIAGPAGLDLGGYHVLAVEGAGAGSFFQPCASGGLGAGAAYFDRQLPAGTVIQDDTGKGTGFVVVCFSSTSGDIAGDGDCDVVLSPMPSSDSNLPEGALSNLWDCADGILLRDSGNQLVDAVSYEGHVANQGAYGSSFVGAPDIGRDWGLITDFRRSLAKTTDTLQRETNESNWAYTGNDGDSPGLANGAQDLSCYTLPGYTHARYPIVLVHGLLGFDSLFGAVDYWFEIVGALEDGGAEVFVTAASQLATPQQRGAQIIPQIEAILSATGASKVNLVGHSQGAIDIRYIAAVRPDLVASVTAVAGPHQGAELADFMVDNFHDGSFGAAVIDLFGTALGDIIKLVSGSPYPNDAMPALQALTSANMAQFNQSYPQGLPATSCGNGAAIVNGIRYFSWSGTATQTNPLDDTDDFLSLTSLVYSEPNDGLVGRCSSHLGVVIKDDYFHNHLDETNHLLGLTPWLVEKDPRDIFRAHANRLKNLGL